MADVIEGENARGEVDCGAGTTITPVNDHGGSIEGAGVGEGPAQGRRIVLVDGGGAEAQLHIGRRHVVDRYSCAAAAAVVILVGERGRNGETGIAGRVVQILMADRSKREHAGRQVDRRVLAVAPLDVDRVSVEDAWIGEGAGERGR